MPVVAVGAIGAVIAALMALLVIYGLSVLGKSLAQLIPNWHIPGLGNIRSFFVNAIDGAVSAVSDLLSMAVAPIANWLLAPYHLLNELISRIINTAHDIYHAILAVKAYAGSVYTSLYHFIGNRVTALEHLAYTLYQQAINVAHSLVNELSDYVAGRVTALIHLADFLYQQAVNIAHALVQELSGYLAGRVTALEHLIQFYYGQAVAQAEALAARGEAYARAVAHSAALAAVGVLTTDVIHAITRGWIDIRDEVKTLEGVLATDLPDIGALVRAIPDAIPVSLAGVAAGDLAIERVMVRYLAECGIPNCRNLGGFGKLLQDLLSLAGGAGLLAMLAEMINDPAQAVTDTIDTLDVVVTDTVRGFEDLIGAA